jgi:hypothetical protein
MPNSSGRMKRWFVIAGVCAVLVGGATTAASVMSGPPPSLASHLTPNGVTLWNLDALMNDAFPLRNPCLDFKHDSFYSVPTTQDCTGPSRPATSHYSYVFTYLGAVHSQFRLVRLAKPPTTGVTNVPLRVGGRFIQCPLGMHSHGRGWLVFGGGQPPNAEIWCN